MSKLLTPKFLTVPTASAITDMVLNAVMFSGQLPLMRQMCHIVVLVPAVEDAREADYPDFPNYPIRPCILYERSIGEEEWPHEFDNIARCKAQQLWRDQNTDGQTDSNAHLLFPDDTPYWGGVKRHGIVVACSGVQPWFDQMISGMIADALKAVGRELFEISDDKARGASFLT